MKASYRDAGAYSAYEGAETWFRVALIPEPTTALLALAAAGLFTRRRRSHD